MSSFTFLHYILTLFIFYITSLQFYFYFDFRYEDYTDCQCHCQQCIFLKLLHCQCVLQRDKLFTK